MQVSSERSSGVKFMYVVVVPALVPRQQFAEMKKSFEEFAETTGMTWLVVADPTADQISFWWLPLE